MRKFVSLIRRKQLLVLGLLSIKTTRFKLLWEIKMKNKCFRDTLRSKLYTNYYVCRNLVLLYQPFHQNHIQLSMLPRVVRKSYNVKVAYKNFLKDWSNIQYFQTKVQSIYFLLSPTSQSLPVPLKILICSTYSTIKIKQ